MKVYWSDDYNRLYPVPAMAVVVADNEAQARELLKARLRAEKLDDESAFTLHEVTAAEPSVVAFINGDY